MEVRENRMSLKKSLFRVVSKASRPRCRGHPARATDVLSREGVIAVRPSAGTEKQNDPAGTTGRRCDREFGAGKA
jgi:hypothetical protein